MSDETKENVEPIPAPAAASLGSVAPPTESGVCAGEPELVQTQRRILEAFWLKKAGTPLVEPTPQDKAEARAACAAFVAEGLARLVKGDGLDPENRDPRADWLPCGGADCVFYLGGIHSNRSISNESGDSTLLREVIESSLEAAAICYLRPPGEEWCRRNPGMRGIHVPKFATPLIPPALRALASKLVRPVEWFYASEIGGPEISAEYHERELAARFVFFPVEDGIWAGLFV